MECGPTIVSVVSRVGEEPRLEPAQNHNMVDDLAQESPKCPAMKTLVVSKYITSTSLDPHIHAWSISVKVSSKSDSQR